MFFAAIIGVAVTMLLLLARALLGPSAYDRILAINLFGTKTVLFVSVLGFLNGRPEFLDLGLIYALINFIGTIAVLKFMQYGDLGWDEASKDEPDV
ncbi:monovalent cation/H+ antiporter complex subunit F [Salinisphaera sp. T31B1]|uniref:monovalent cation/H+ antiporter complex subunit F n=1 Tax=Salinisphaera sp. T31B1 TaxID=727963 RepID=UPI00334267A2